MNQRLPTSLRITLIAGLFLLVAAGAFKTYRYMTAPITLTIAASEDEDSFKLMTALSARLNATNAHARLRIVPAANMGEAAKLFSADKVDLALLRADMGDQANARTVVVGAHAVVLMLLPADSKIEDFDDLRGKTIGVVNGEVNRRVVDALVGSYNLDRAKFRDITAGDAQKLIQTKQIQALLVVTPVTEKYLGLARALLGLKPKQKPGVIAIEQAEAISNTYRAYENYDLPKGTLWGSPPVPDEDMTTLRVPVNLVAARRVPNDVITELTKSVMESRTVLAKEFPILNQLSAPSTDKDAFIPLHPGAAVYYEGNEKNFFEKYGDALFYGPMFIGLLASALAGIWKFLGVGGAHKSLNHALGKLAALMGRVREAQNEDDLTAIEDAIDAIVQAELTVEANGDDPADMSSVSVAIARLEKAIERRRTALRAGEDTSPPVAAPTRPTLVT